MVKISIVRVEEIGFEFRFVVFRFEEEVYIGIGRSFCCYGNEGVVMSLEELGILWV